MKRSNPTLVVIFILLVAASWNGCATIIGMGFDQHFTYEPFEPFEPIPPDSLQLLVAGDHVLIELTSGEHLRGTFKGMDNDTTFVLYTSSKGKATHRTLGLRPWQIVSIQRYLPPPKHDLGPWTKAGITVDVLFVSLVLLWRLFIPPLPNGYA